jgi:Aldehyde dehydrogenase family
VRQGLRGLVDDARAKGAWIVDMGKCPETAQGRPRTLAPVLVLGATDEMAVMQEEIFGPVLPVLTYRNMDDAVAYVNAHPRPLALYYFGGDNADRRKVLSRTTSGSVGINNTLMHYTQDDLPFGGVGASGMGAYHGVEGFRHEPRQGDLRAEPAERGRSATRAVRAAGGCGAGADAAVGEAPRRGWGQAADRRRQHLIRMRHPVFVKLALSPLRFLVRDMLLRELPDPAGGVGLMFLGEMAGEAAGARDRGDAAHDVRRKINFKEQGRNGAGRIDRQVAAHGAIEFR